MKKDTAAKCKPEKAQDARESKSQSAKKSLAKQVVGTARFVPKSK